MDIFFDLFAKGDITTCSDWYFEAPRWMVHYLTRDEFYVMSYLIMNTQMYSIHTLNDKHLGRSHKVTHEKMAKELRSSISAIKRVLTSLEQMGLIIKKRCSNGNLYCPDYNVMSDMTYAIWENDYPELLIALREEYKNMDLHDVVKFIEGDPRFNI